MDDLSLEQIYNKIIDIGNRTKEIREEIDSITAQYKADKIPYDEFEKKFTALSEEAKKVTKETEDLQPYIDSFPKE